MKTLIIAASLILTSCASAYDLNRSALDNSNTAYIPHSNYVTYEVQYAPVKIVYEDLVKHEGQLKNRGESHITVITPPEFDETLKKKISMAEINALAVKEKLQSAKYEPVCVGMGASGEMRTYYIVVTSPDLVKFRQKVMDLYVSKGGAKKDFEPTMFYPHITLGFTDRDLFDSDGIIKSERTCLSDGRISIH